MTRDLVSKSKTYAHVLPQIPSGTLPCPCHQQPLGTELESCGVSITISISSMDLFINSKLWKELRKILQSQDSHFKIFYLKWFKSIFKVFIEFVTILLLFSCFDFFFASKACGILASQSVTELATPALESEVLSTSLPGKWLIFLKYSFPLWFIIG